MEQLGRLDDDGAGRDSEPREGDDGNSATGDADGGVPVDQLPAQATNRIPLADGDAAGQRLVERVTDPDGDVIDPPRSRSFTFASSFAEEFD